MPNAGLDTMRRIKVPPGAGVLRLIVTGMVVGEFISPRGVVDGAEVPHRVISATRELISEDQVMEF
jgi:hypothetical protein